MYRELGTERERRLQKRRRKRIVDGDDRAACVRAGDERGKIGNLKQWIRRTFQPQQTAARNGIQHGGGVP